MMKQVGRPALDSWDKYQLVHKLEPYLKMGLSIRKSCFLSGVPKSSVYKYMQTDSQFSDTIEHFQNFHSFLISHALTKKLITVVKKQETLGILEGRDLRFLMWLAVHSKNTKEEFWHHGEKHFTNDFDPQIEIRKLTKYIDQIADDV